MILNKTVKIKITTKTISFYKKRGYNINKIGDEININIDDLQLGSKVIVDVECDVCKKVKKIQYVKYIKNISKYNTYTCSTKCSSFKFKLTSIEKYGVEHPSQSDEIKNKIINTVKGKYGVSNVFKSEEIKNKIKTSNNEKYGVDYPQQNSVILEKSIKSNLLNYGVRRPSQSELLKYKYIKNCKETLKQKFNSDFINILNIDYKDNGTVNAKCINNHNFNINLKTLYSRTLNKSVICTVCNPIEKQTSILEQEIFTFIRNNYNNKILTNNRREIGLELDIYLPELNLAFEFNGLYWHNELNKEKKYHYNKSNLCDEKGIQLIHIWEDDWLYKQDIVKSMILNKIGKTTSKIYARSCEIKVFTDNKLIRSFLDISHIQGYVGSSIKLGLFYKDELVSLMTFGNHRKIMNSITKDTNKYELLRFCNKLNTNVIGGASKLFKYFLKTYNPSQITTYADRSYSNGNLYKQLGFELIYISDPNYYYIIDRKRYYRFSFRKDILIKQGYDENKSEHEIMLERKIYRIYNAGNYKFIFDNII